MVAAIRAAGGKADFIAADLGDADSVRALGRRATEIGGGHVDILVNNAGLFPFGPTQGTSDQDIDTVYAVNAGATPPRTAPGDNGAHWPGRTMRCS